MTKEQSVQARNLFGKDERDRQPFVISMIPSKNAEMFAGKREKIGEKHSITMKNIVIIEPTDSMESVEFVTMSASEN